MMDEHDDVNMRCHLCGQPVIEGQYVMGAKIVPARTMGNPSGFVLGLRDKFHPSCLAMTSTHAAVAA